MTRRSDDGFTLLEVLAAVAILGLLYSVLATTAIRGLRAEGDAGRRLHADLVADARLAELEAAAMTGALPKIGDEETDDGDLRVRTSISALELPAVSALAPAAKRGAPRAPGAPGAAGVVPAPVGSFLAPAAGGGPGPLRRIEVRVSWAEGAGEEAVVRSTYALDAEAAAPLLQALDQAAEQQAGAAKKENETTPETPQPEPTSDTPTDASSTQDTTE